MVLTFLLSPTQPLRTALFEASQQGITAEVCLIIQDLK
jgi:hypothetical protein